jgi:hypothetical protein
VFFKQISSKKAAFCAAGFERTALKRSDAIRLAKRECKLYKKTLINSANIST